MMDLIPLFSAHPRHWRENRYVYPVISRRGGGLSVGVNLNPDKACNFDCIYCQVDRSVPPTVRKVDIAALREELEHMARLVVSGELFDDGQFAHVPEQWRRFNDIAFSGDGEPTACPQFVDAVRIAADIRRDLHLDDVKLVLITDSAFLDRPAVREGLAILDANNGEIWAKLDAGTEAHYQAVNRPNVPLAVILRNITEAARARPVVIQSLWMKIHDQPPPAGEAEAFAARLKEITDAGGQLKLVQVHTVARQTAEAYVAPLDRPALEAIAEAVRRQVNAPVHVYE